MFNENIKYYKGVVNALFNKYIKYYTVYSMHCSMST